MSACVTHISQLVSLVCSHLAVVAAVVALVAVVLACRLSRPYYCYCSCCCCCCCACGCCSGCCSSAASINLRPAFWHLYVSLLLLLDFSSVCLPCLWATHLSVVGFIFYLFRAVVLCFYAKNMNLLRASACACVLLFVYVSVCVCVCLDILSILFARCLLLRLLLLILLLPTYSPAFPLLLICVNRTHVYVSCVGKLTLITGWLVVLASFCVLLLLIL